MEKDIGLAASGQQRVYASLGFSVNTKIIEREATNMKRLTLIVLALLICHLTCAQETKPGAKKI
jgi:hypothetical protein